MQLCQPCRDSSDALLRSGSGICPDLGVSETVGELESGSGSDELALVDELLAGLVIAGVAEVDRHLGQLLVTIGTQGLGALFPLTCLTLQMKTQPEVGALSRRILSRNPVRFESKTPSISPISFAMRVPMGKQLSVRSSAHSSPTRLGNR
jgi:hypothetical protein